MENFTAEECASLPIDLFSLQIPFELLKFQFSTQKYFEFQTIAPNVIPIISFETNAVLLFIFLF